MGASLIKYVEVFMSDKTWRLPITLRDTREEARAVLLQTVDEANEFVRKVKQWQSVKNAPWLEALDRQQEAIKKLTRVIENLEKRPELKDKEMNWESELVNFKNAEVFSFSGHALEAIKIASQSIPPDVELEGSNIPGNGTGWWWFDPPLPIKTQKGCELLQGVLFGLHVTVDKEEFRHMARKVDDEMFALDNPQNAWMDFSCWTVDEENQLQPSTTFSWKIGAPLSTLISKVGKAYEEYYGVGPREWEGSDIRIGKEPTLHAVEEIARFYLAASVWMAQDIIEAVPQRIRKVPVGASRSEKKRVKTQHVKVIALRRKHFQETADPSLPLGESTREWSCQWVVSGHWRNQPFGPGRTARRLVYINPFVKGPEDKPLKPAQKKVYAVMR